MLGAQLPKVSVIIPVYNMADHVEACLDSVLAAGYPTLELIIVDDGSTDQSLALCQQKLAGCAGVKILSQVNAGQGAARNNALSHASGKYILFVDSDDTIDPCLFSKTVPLMEASCYDFINFGLDFVEAGGRVRRSIVPRRYPELSGRAIFERAMMDEEIFSSPVNKLYAREFLDRHNIRFPETRGCEDIYFSRVLAFHASSTAFVPEVLYHALMRQGSTTRNAGAGLMTAGLEVLRLEKAYFQDKGVLSGCEALYQRHYAKEVAYFIFVLAYRARDIGVFSDAVKRARSESEFQRLADSEAWADVSLKYKFFLMGSRFPGMLRAVASLLALLNIKPY